MPDIESSRPGLISAAMNEEAEIRRRRARALTYRDTTRVQDPLTTEDWGRIVDAVLDAIPSAGEGVHDVRDVDLDGAIRDEIAETFFDREARHYVLIAESYLREDLSFPDTPRDTGRLHIITSNGTSSAHVRGMLETAIDGLRRREGSLE